MLGEKNKQGKKSGRKKRRFSILRLFSLLFIMFAAAFAFGIGINLFLQPTGQTVADNKVSSENSAFYRVKRAMFIKNEVNAKISGKSLIPLEEMPRDLIHAIVAVEDNRFFSHHGVDFTAIGRATIANIEAGGIEEGASTITQQLVKNLFLSSEQTFDRKIEEVILALDMEAVYEKEEILELYLNTIYFGSNFYGINEAALGYFGKSPKELNLEESAMLAGLPNAPSVYSPYVNLELAVKRQHIVLDAMEKNGYIIASTAKKAKNASLHFAKKENKGY
ncbi:MAG: transglycosylase domain-containing protein [Selenomonadaceae bacterium]|nr:transglycosylase domain-containing protein [Selenomonadaceae bacterium]